MTWLWKKYKTLHCKKPYSKKEGSTINQTYLPKEYSMKSIFLHDVIASSGDRVGRIDCWWLPDPFQEGGVKAYLPLFTYLSPSGTIICPTQANRRLHASKRKPTTSGNIRTFSLLSGSWLNAGVIDDAECSSRVHPHAHNRWPTTTTRFWVTSSEKPCRYQPWATRGVSLSIYAFQGEKDIWR